MISTGNWDERALMNHALVPRDVGCLQPTHIHLIEVFSGAALRLSVPMGTQV